ncbi:MULTISPECIES: MlaD family protein [Methylobacter]|uniref:Mammalian cell entry related domain protein n=1 Tax=Methylobacter tundripaludum (strain ATCC BAA-1195 / DSM 17260 / SV96) TaxID=697282 RepID=G3IS04_METTV|nr:MlaD family protein [Methylobacter tundripaludum]EGW22215.1 Mammalian cell entry related domain protein [Methylobacter tundripaludum SV96]
MGRENHALITGLFLIALVTASTAIIFWIGTMNQERNLYAISTRASVSGLNPESTVFYRGIAVGKVLNVQFDPLDSGTILVPIEVDKKIVLSKGVYATLRLKGVTGLTQIQLEDSGTISEELPPGDNPMTRIPLVPSLTDKLMDSGEELLHKADHLMQRLSSLLNDENEKNIGGILSNLKTLTDKLSELQKSVDKALAGVPELTTDARKTMSNIDALANELQGLTREVKNLSAKAGNLVDSGKNTGDALAQTTLPKVNKLLTELQSTTQQVKRVATMLENNPQELLLGPTQRDAGPGEPGYKEQQ